jgi:hypothetical protein
MLRRLNPVWNNDLSAGASGGPSQPASQTRLVPSGPRRLKESAGEREFGPDWPAGLERRQ